MWIFVYAYFLDHHCWILCRPCCEAAGAGTRPGWLYYHNADWHRGCTGCQVYRRRDGLLPKHGSGRLHRFRYRGDNSSRSLPSRCSAHSRVGSVLPWDSFKPSNILILRYLYLLGLREGGPNATTLISLSHCIIRNYAVGGRFLTSGRRGPPHPCPLPKERVNRLHRTNGPRFSDFSSAVEMCSSPWGEGWGEGPRCPMVSRAAQKQSTVSKSSSGAEEVPFHNS